MKNNNQQIIAQIKELLDQLDGVKSPIVSHNNDSKVRQKKQTGCSGAIQSLIGDGFFDKAVDLTQVIEKLAEEGQPYGNALVSMNLLNLVKPPRRILRRLKLEGKWKYIVRN